MKPGHFLHASCSDETVYEILRVGKDDNDIPTIDVKVLDANEVIHFDHNDLAKGDGTDEKGSGDGVSYLVSSHDDAVVFTVPNVEDALPASRALGQGATVKTEGGVLLAVVAKPGRTSTADRFVPVAWGDRAL